MKAMLLILFGLSAGAQVGSRAQIYHALVENKVLDPDRELVHFSHACTLRIDGGAYPVVDLQEIVKGASTPRAVNRIIVFNSGWKPVQKIDYTTQRPLFCVDNRLSIYGDLTVGNVLPEGNVLTFSSGGKMVAVSQIEANDYPLPVNRDRRVAPQ